ncbi:MAG: Dihydroorotate oxidase [Candidatus Woesebacteria bacterium GW2011_GWB1_38_5b]|uniref:Dihydroorotate oxidase n=2 Tax=Microgenomates group TaxID=1794810 RepID=A0A0G0QN21_9BACT|nr:MAG: Dihydroorotate oxidase [Candidatus Woesebacteria bacterium GW2011_GWB1_38_5b]KKR16554.1 MAG: Dihydroorotate oxidase [Candidatus Daviesbacteria bacterium GW2011_GWA2_39_33]KKR41819.1 MAG: Dihydroorotate oxidase [Candidatus Daviesbacteria bacterium GW2011_GWC2_40_12]
MICAKINGNMLQIPFYDPNKSYEENYDQGPYGDFADGKVFNQEGEPQVDFLGQKVFTPFGIPAGPLVNSKFCKAAFEKGFDICVYKTVRTAFFPCHPHPNILSVKVEGDLTVEKAQEKLIADNNYSEPLSITNSFGVPSKEPIVWKEDVKKAISFTGKGQVLVLSFMGTVRERQSPEDFIADYALAAKLSVQTGAKVLEMNLSCPNIGNEGLVCYNLEMTQKVCQAVRKEIGDIPLILKVGYYKKEQGKDLEELVEICENYAQGIASINTIQAEIIDKDGSQALPGKSRARSGVCGACIKWAGLDMVKRLKQLTVNSQQPIAIIGVGGVIKPEDYFEYMEAGADAVMSATGAMWDPNLAKEIKKKS